MGNTLIAYQKWEDMAEYILKCVVNQLPKSERYALGEQIRRLTVGIGKEVYDIRTTGFDWGDVKADCVGIGIALLLWGVGNMTAR